MAFALKPLSLLYNWHRYYDPSLGRYISADPIGQTGGVNVYSYAVNSPINRVDPAGLWVASVGNFGSAGAGVGGHSQASLAVDSSGNVGVVLTQSGGAQAGVSGSVGIVGGVSSAPTIYDQAGPSAIAGGSGGVLGSAGVDASVFQDRAGNTQGSLELQIGVGTGADAHLQAGATTVIPLFNIPDALAGLLGALGDLFGGQEDCP